MTLQEAYEQAQRLKLLADFAHARAAANRGHEAERHTRRAERMEREARRLIRESE